MDQDTSPIATDQEGLARPSHWDSLINHIADALWHHSKLDKSECLARAKKCIDVLVPPQSAPMGQAAKRTGEPLTPREEVEDSLFGLVVGALNHDFHPAEEADQIRGFIHAFLTEYPAIAQSNEAAAPADLSVIDECFKAIREVGNMTGRFGKPSPVEKAWARVRPMVDGTAAEKAVKL